MDGPAIPTLLGLLGHDNTDIAMEVTALLKEVTDEGGSLQEGREGPQGLLEGGGRGEAGGKGGRGSSEEISLINVILG